MHRPPPPLNFIRSFECAARHLSFTIAAKELGYTQAAISMHVRSLEKYVGRPLFHRNPRSLTLTEMGEAFLPTLYEALAQIDSATESIVSSARDQTVIIACPMSLAVNWMSRCLKGFQATNPDIEIVIHGTVWDSDADPISDITISLNRGDDIPDGAQRLWQDKLTLLASPDMASRITKPADILELPKIFVLGRQEYWTDFVHSIGIGPIDFDRGLRTNGSNIALDFAANGMGLTASLSSLAEVYLERGLLVEPFESRPQSPWNYYIKMHNRTKGSADRKVANWIIAAGQAHI
jgi:LysR family glycine cleavage system transcriptional activator